MNLKLAPLRFAVIILVFSGYGFSQENKAIELDYSWERLILLVSKEADVRQLLGEPYLDSGQVKVYRVNSFGFRVLYNGSRESGKQVCDSDQISADTVYGISVTLSSPLPFTEFKIRPETRELADYERIESDSGTVE
ncbi:MAG: hypothetical protein KIS76_01795 [Pyrinomonadaceae bacterium]|nr:hypothetical protein [Pyrinomonadaceae bacterium]